MTEMTEAQVRKIAREEASSMIKDIKMEIESLRKVTTENRTILSRLERLLLGEIGVNEDETLKAKATYAYSHARKVEDSGILIEAKTALKWFDDMNTPDKGCIDSKLDILGKMIVGWSSIKWIAGFFGIVNLATLVGFGIMLFNFVRLVKELGM